MKLSQKAQDVIAFSMKLDTRRKYHYSPWPIEKIASLRSTELSKAKKPLGFWYSWGGAWPLYLLSEYARGMGYSQEGKWAMERLESTSYVYKIDIDFSRILKIRSKKDFRNFCEQYGCPTDDRFAKYSDYPCIINWKKVYRDHWGIDIRFDVDMSYDCFWYERWDCHSGCIWKPTAIKDYKEVWVHKLES